MAIKKCPYCKAIIDETAQYCANCGTQLLFPEDEGIEEGIPGERIVDEVVEEEKEPEVEEDVEEILEEEEAEWKKPLVSKEEARGERWEDEPERIKKLEELVGKRIEDASDEELRFKRETTEGKEEEAPKEETIPEENIEEIREVGEKVFETEELDKIEAAGEVDQEEIERILSDFKKRERKDIGKVEEIPEQDEIPPWAEQLREAPSSEIPPQVEEKEIKEREEVREASRIEEKLKEIREKREEIIEERETEPQEEIIPLKEEVVLEEEMPDEGEERVIDSGIGLPEQEVQKGLPFDEEEGEYEEEEEMLDTREDFHPASRIPARLKARVFDIFLITFLWLVTIWYASRLIEVSIIKLIQWSSPAILGFYLILLVCYFFLFLFFLGRTLGDRLFLRES